MEAVAGHIGLDEAEQAVIKQGLMSQALADYYELKSSMEAMLQWKREELQGYLDSGKPMSEKTLTDRNEQLRIMHEFIGAAEALMNEMWSGKAGTVPAERYTKLQTEHSELRRAIETATGVSASRCLRIQREVLRTPPMTISDILPLTKAFLTKRGQER